MRLPSLVLPRELLNTGSLSDFSTILPTWVLHSFVWLLNQLVDSLNWWARDWSKLIYLLTTKVCTHMFLSVAYSRLAWLVSFTLMWGNDIILFARSADLLVISKSWLLDAKDNHSSSKIAPSWRFTTKCTRSYLDLLPPNERGIAGKINNSSPKMWKDI